MNNSDIHVTRAFDLSATDMPDGFSWQIQKHRQALLPLIEQLLPVYEDQSVDLAFCNKPSSNGGFSECCWSTKDTVIILCDP